MISKLYLIKQSGINRALSSLHWGPWYYASVYLNKILSIYYSWSALAELWVELVTSCFLPLGLLVYFEVETFVWLISSEIINPFRRIKSILFVLGFDQSLVEIKRFKSLELKSFRRRYPVKSLQLSCIPTKSYDLWSVMTLIEIFEKCNLVLKDLII